MKNRREDIRNIGIIAHVDHGKTTLVDKLLKQSGLFRENEVVHERMMDSNDQEKERGITILAKNASFKYKDKQINIVDTPGHADFSGEVERILKMVDGVCILVDAFEGAMPQTRFVTSKALAFGLKPIVIINKVDREGSRPSVVLNQIYDLFIELDASEDQLDFPVIYCSAKNGVAGLDSEKLDPDLTCLVEKIVEEIPGPIFYPNDPLQVLVTNLDYNEYLGQLGVGRILAGQMTIGQSVVKIGENNLNVSAKISKIFKHEGMQRVEVKEATAGDIVIWSGIDNLIIGDTIADSTNPIALERIEIEAPTVTMDFIVNDSPFSGIDGKFVTSRNLRDRLFKEAKTNVALRVEDTDKTNTFRVSGRGELHLSVLIESMRRESFEFQVSRPKIIFKEDDGKRQEPIERLIIDAPDEFSGNVIELLGRRKGELVNMDNTGSMTRLTFNIPSRGLIGFRNQFLTMTKGYGIMNSSIEGYEDYKGEIPERMNGSLVAKENTDSNSYAIYNLQDRGELFVSPGDKVYKGQVVGEHNRTNDLTVSIGKAKKLSNMRASGSDENLMLSPPRKFSLEESIEYINDDELVEITPKHIRIRKKYLDENERKKFSKKI